MVPPSVRIFAALLHYNTHKCTLCQVSPLNTWLSSILGYLCYVRINSLIIAHSFYNVEKTQIRAVTALEIHYTQPGGITGHVMLLCMLLMYTT